MKFYSTILLVLTCCCWANAQNSYEVTIKSEETQDPLIGVSVYMPKLAKGSISNEKGKVLIQDIPNGDYQLRISHVGYKTVRIRIEFPLPDSLNDQILFLSPASEEMGQVTITSTRSSRTIEDIPTRIEFIAGEELAEKGNMKPGDIRMLLNESTGIQTQQTSATSYNSSIRIQGLDGRYTQLLRDGMPLYSGFSGGLSLMQIAPLDLKQVEVIKGASSTLYGGGAIAGLVNLISKTPEDERELSFMLNGTSALGFDASTFYAEKFGKIGTTVFASFNKGRPYDPSDIGLTAIPKFDRITLNPRIFLYLSDRTEMNIGANLIRENRLGGNMDYVKGRQAPGAYYEKNETDRVSSQFEIEHRVSALAKFTFKNSISHYDRSIEIPQFLFSGKQLSSFSEFGYSHFTDKSEWVMGLNLWTDEFSQSAGSALHPLDYHHTTLGGFIQNTWTASEKVSLETGFRTDFQSEYGWFALPRLSLMVQPNPALTVRLGGGLGYKTPTLFSEDAERLQFRNVLPIDVNNTDAERSIGSNLDVNYRIPLTEELSLNTNTLLFYTRIKNPLVLTRTGDCHEFKQPNGYVDTKGIEMNMKLSYHDFKLFIGYTLADVKNHYNGASTTFPLVAKHRLNNVLMFEKEENLWVGLEAYYFSPQKLSDGQIGQSYWILGLMSEKMIGEHFSIFLNFENFLDTRQTAFDTIFTGNINSPHFREIYAPVDGFVINGGIKVKL